MLDMILYIFSFRTKKKMKKYKFIYSFIKKKAFTKKALKKNSYKKPQVVKAIDRL